MISNSQQFFTAKVFRSRGLPVDFMYYVVPSILITMINHYDVVFSKQRKSILSFDFAER